MTLGRGTRAAESRHFSAKNQALLPGYRSQTRARRFVATAAQSKKLREVGFKFVK
jgi:hypothetical protein